MARKRRSSGPRRGSATPVRSLPSVLSLTPITDLRVWHPERLDRPVLNYDGNFSRITIGTRRHHLALHRRPLVARSRMFRRPVGLQLPVGLMFESPLRVGLCVRRKVRRQVLFAYGKTRRGAGAGRRRRSWRSSISC